jgi:recombination protein RecT
MVRSTQLLHVINQSASTEDALTKPLTTRSGWMNGQLVPYASHDAPFGELALTCPQGEHLHYLDWRTNESVWLLKSRQRQTAPNPGVMTGPGTNTYLVGDPDTGYLAIDPGPADAEHIDRLWRAAGGDIRMIVCTHSHSDHSPGAAPLQALCVAHGKRPPILGLSSAPTARANSAFTPERELVDGEPLVLACGTHQHTLRVVHTPGHAANHLCLVLEEDGLLFSGDHILNGSTTVVDPPDGHMTDYLESLDKLLNACEHHHIQFILPAHGYVLGNMWGEPHDARACITHLKAHRLKREAKILAVMQQHPEGSMDDWVKHAYDDVPAKLWPVAKRSLLAHVERLQNL